MTFWYGFFVGFSLAGLCWMLKDWALNIILTAGKQARKAKEEEKNGLISKKEKEQR